MTLLPQPGAIFDGKYRIERVLGRGAMAVVFEATHLNLDDRVAIKLLLPELAANAELVERFMREGRAATRIRSEHVVRVFDVGIADAHPYLVMEYLDGSDLDQVLASDGPMPVALAADYLLQACEAIAEVHARGIVHRDLKPANLFLTRRLDGSPCVKVLDFGISKAAPGDVPDTRTTEPATVMGSPHYMSPEQMLSSTAVDARADVWALGAILHELLVGSPAFTGETIAALSASVLRDAPPSLTALRPDVGPGVEAVVLRCLMKDPGRRYANVAELAFALADFGSASARAAAELISPVLETGTGKLSMPSARPPDVKSIPSAAALLAGTTPPSRPPRPRGRVLGYLMAAVAVVGIGGAIARMAVRDEQVERARVTVTNAKVGAPASAAPSVAPSAAPAASVAQLASNAKPAASTATVLAVPTPAPPPAKPTHASRHAPRPQPRIAPLPDFPIPSNSEGEPPARPISPSPP